MTVYVTNRWEKPLAVDMAGVEIQFPVGEMKEITEHQARHIFGWKKEDRTDNVIFLGLARTSNDMPEGFKILDKFEIIEKLPEQNHSLSPVVERVPFPVTRERGKIAAA